MLTPPAWASMLPCRKPVVIGYRAFGPQAQLFAFGGGTAAGPTLMDAGAVIV